MGGNVTEINGELRGKADNQNGTVSRTERGSGTSSSSTDTSSRRGNDIGRTDTDRGTSADGNKTDEKIIPQMVVVSGENKTEEQKREERNAKRRERYAQQKIESGQSVKPRKVNKPKKETKNDSVTEEQLTALVVAVSSTIASRPNCEQWLITESEVKSIVKPLLAILSENEKIEMLTQNSNQIALAIACITVFAPRILVTVQKMKSENDKKKIAIEKDNVNNGQIRKAKADNQNTNRADVGTASANGQGNGDGLSWFGSPIS